jgi:hypothetical protein
MMPDPQDLLNLPERPPRSKLEPFRAVIRDLRLKNWSYREIAALFGESLNLAVAPSTLHNFVRVRATEKASPAIPAPLIRKLGHAGGSAPEQNSSPARSPQLFEFTPGEALKLSPQERNKK